MAFGDNSNNQMDSGNFGGNVSQSTTNANDSYDFSSFENDGPNGGNSFGGDNENNADPANSAEESQQGGDDLNELLGQSPFGPLLDIPGVDGAEDIFGNVGGGAGGQMGGSQGGAGSGNPFANFNPLEDGNPFIEGDEPNVSFSGAGDSAEGNPFGSDAPSENDGVPIMDGSQSNIPANYSEAENADSDSFSGAVSEDAGNYDFSEVQGEYDFSNFDGGADGFGDGVSANDSEMEADGGGFSGVFPEDAGSYSYDFSEVDGQYDYDFSGDGENPFAGGMSSDVASGNPFAGGGNEGSNPFASGDIPSGDTEISGSMTDDFGM